MFTRIISGLLFLVLPTHAAITQELTPWVKLLQTTPNAVPATDREIRVGKTNLVVALRLVDAANGPAVLVLTPTVAKIQLHAISIDNIASLRLPAAQCPKDLCFVLANVTPEFIDHLRTGSMVTLQGQDSTGKPINFVFPLAGFARAYAGPPQDVSTWLAFTVPHTSSQSTPAPASTASMSTLVTRTDEQPSFDCSKAKTASARLICADADLAKLDSQLGREFQTKKQQIAATDQAAFVANEVKWIRERNQKCGLLGRDNAPSKEPRAAKQCMITEINERINELEARANDGSASSKPLTTKQTQHDGTRDRDTIGAKLQEAHLLGDWGIGGCQSSLHKLFYVDPNGSAFAKTYNPSGGTPQIHQILDVLASNPNAIAFTFYGFSMGKSDETIYVVYRLEGDQLHTINSRNKSGTLIVENEQLKVGNGGAVAPMQRCDTQVAEQPDPIIIVPPSATNVLPTLNVPGAALQVSLDCGLGTNQPSNIPLSPQIKSGGVLTLVLMSDEQTLKSLLIDYPRLFSLLNEIKGKARAACTATRLRPVPQNFVFRTSWGNVAGYSVGYDDRWTILSNSFKEEEDRIRSQQQIAQAQQNAENELRAKLSALPTVVDNDLAHPNAQDVANCVKEIQAKNNCPVVLTAVHKADRLIEDTNAVVIADVDVALI